MRHALTMLVMAIAMAAAPGLAFSQAASQPATGPSSQPAKELLLDLGKKITMKLTLVPSGTFLMGCAQGEKDAKEAETCIGPPTSGPPIPPAIRRVQEGKIIS